MCNCGQWLRSQMSPTRLALMSGASCGWSRRPNGGAKTGRRSNYRRRISSSMLCDVSAGPVNGWNAFPSARRWQTTDNGRWLFWVTPAVAKPRCCSFWRWSLPVARKRSQSTSTSVAQTRNDCRSMCRWPAMTRCSARPVT